MAPRQRLSARYATADQHGEATAVHARRAERPRVLLATWHIAVIALLLVTVVAGTLFSLGHSTPEQMAFRTRLPAVRSTTTASKLAFPVPIPVPTYFADKRNLLNQIFVKRGWAWTTLAVVLFYGATLVEGQSTKTGTRPASLRPLLRWAIATFFWFQFTQWFFGQSINHRVLMATGAQCSPASMSGTTPATPISPLDPDVLMRNPGAGPWSAHGAPGGVAGSHVGADIARGPMFCQGGHDISGHTFILTHSILLILSTIAPALPALFGSAKRPTLPPLQRAAALFALALVGLYWWMLLMTACFFHRGQEKLSGLAVGLLGFLSYRTTVG